MILNKVLIRYKKGFTLVELLVVISIIAMLLAVLMPSLQKARALAKGVVCKSQLRQIGLSIQIYADDWDNYISGPGYDWSIFVEKEPYMNTIGGQLRGTLGVKNWICPADNIYGGKPVPPSDPASVLCLYKSSYDYNANRFWYPDRNTTIGEFRKITKYKRPSEEQIIMCKYKTVIGREIEYFHGRGTNILNLDTSVSFIEKFDYYAFGSSDWRKWAYERAPN